MKSTVVAVIAILISGNALARVQCEEYGLDGRLMKRETLSEGQQDQYIRGPNGAVNIWVNPEMSKNSFQVSIEKDGRLKAVFRANSELTIDLNTPAHLICKSVD